MCQKYLYWPLQCGSGLLVNEFLPTQTEIGSLNRLNMRQICLDIPDNQSALDKK